MGRGVESEPNAVEIERSALGEARFWSPRAGVVWVRFLGTLDEPIAQVATTRFSRLAQAQGGIEAHLDWSSLAKYTSQARNICTAWFLRDMRLVRCFAICAPGSPILRMGVSVANIALGNRIQIVDDVEALCAGARVRLAELPPALAA